MKKSLSIVLSLIMIITTLAALPFTAHALPASGDCGDSATYTFDSSTGALVISGTGIIRDYFDGFAGSTISKLSKSSRVLPKSELRYFQGAKLLQA